MLKGSEVKSRLSHKIFLCFHPRHFVCLQIFVREEDIRPEGAISSHVSPIPSRTSALLTSSTQFSTSWVLPPRLLSMYHSTRALSGQSYISAPDVNLRVNGFFEPHWFCFLLYGRKEFFKTSSYILYQCFAEEYELNSFEQWQNFLFWADYTFKFQILCATEHLGFSLTFSPLHLWVKDVVCF